MQQELNASTLTAALKASGPMEVGGLVRWEPQAKGPAEFPRLGNGNIYFQVIKDGKPVAFADKPVNVYQALGMK